MPGIDDKNTNDPIFGAPPPPSEPSSSGVGGAQALPPGVDPNSPKGQLLAAIYKLIEEMKSGKPMDHSSELSSIMSKMTAVSGDMVSSDANTITAMDQYQAASSNMQNAIADKSYDKDAKPDANGQNPTGVPSVNQYTGNPDYLKNSDGTDKLDSSGNMIRKLISPEQAVAQDAEYIKNSPNQKDLLDSSGKDTGKKNPSYSFFHEKNANGTDNMALYNSMAGNVDSVVEGIDSKATWTGTPPQVTIKDGAIKDMWDKTKPTYGPDGKLVTAGDPTQVQTVQSAMASLNQSLTSNSSAVQALAKQDTQAYTTITAVMSKFNQTWISVMKACNNAVKAA